VNSESPTKPQTLDVTPGAIEKYILTESLQHPLTTFSAVTAVLSGLYMLAFGADQTSLLLAAGAGFLSLGTFIFNYFVRGEKLAQNYVREQLEQRRANRETEIVAIRDEFRRLDDKEVSRQRWNCTSVSKIQKLLQAREAQGASMMKSMRLQILAKTLISRRRVLALPPRLRAAAGEQRRELQREVQDWQKQLQRQRHAGGGDSRELSALERRIELNQQRLTSYRQRQSALAELFAESEACEASLEEAYMQFAGAESAPALPKPNVDNAITRLETAVAAARRVETRIRNMQAEDEIYLAAGEQAK
jgi:hypothetical protein